MRYFNDYSPMYYHMSFWPEGLISLLINLLVWGIIIYLVFHLVRKMTAGRHSGFCSMHDHHSYENDDSSYLRVIKMRYAKGEINKKEYDELKKEFSEESEEEEIETTKETISEKE